MPRRFAAPLNRLESWNVLFAGPALPVCGPNTTAFAVLGLLPPADVVVPPTTAGPTAVVTGAVPPTPFGPAPPAVGAVAADPGAVAAGALVAPGAPVAEDSAVDPVMCAIE